MSSEISEMSQASEAPQASQEYLQPSEREIENLMAHFPRLDRLMAETLLIAQKNNMLSEETDEGASQSEQAAFCGHAGEHGGEPRQGEAGAAEPSV